MVKKQIATKAIKDVVPKKAKVEGKKQKKPKVVLVKTEVKFLKISPRKLRLVVNAVKRLSPQEAINRLSVWNKKGARLLGKAIQTAIADAENNFSLKKEKLRFKSIVVNEGPRLKRRDRSHGARFASGVIKKRSSHLKIVVFQMEEEQKNGT